MVAIVVISESEIQKVVPDFTANYETSYPEDFKKMLWNLGGDINSPYERQDGFEHRNRLNEVVLCTRWVLKERIDDSWVNSGYCSREAKNDASGSRMVMELDKFRHERLGN